MASGQRGANGHPGGSAAGDGGTPGIGTRLGSHSVTPRTAGQFDVHLAGNGEATFTAPTQPGGYAFYCTYHPSMKGTLMVQ
jgi:plastocyanin